MLKMVGVGCQEREVEEWASGKPLGVFTLTHLNAIIKPEGGLTL
jgi:hypothetical protein